jgi:hypothetical protein
VFSLLRARSSHPPGRAPAVAPGSTAQVRRPRAAAAPRRAGHARYAAAPRRRPPQGARATRPGPAGFRRSRSRKRRAARNPRLDLRRRSASTRSRASSPSGRPTVGRRARSGLRPRNGSRADASAPPLCRRPRRSPRSSVWSRSDTRCRSGDKWAATGRGRPGALELWHGRDCPAGAQHDSDAEIPTLALDLVRVSVSRLVSRAYNEVERLLG